MMYTEGLLKVGSLDLREKRDEKAAEAVSAAASHSSCVAVEGCEGKQLSPVGSRTLFRRWEDVEGLQLFHEMFSNSFFLRRWRAQLRLTS